MNTCPVTYLPITANPNWQRKEHFKGSSYTKVFRLLGKDILLYNIETDQDITLANMDSSLFRSALHDNNLEDKPTCLVWDLQHVSGISLDYKKQLANLVFNSSITFGIVVFYNVEPQCLTTVETFCAMVPEMIPVLIRKNYSDAVNTVLDWKKGLPVNNEIDQDPDLVNKKEFLAFVGRLCWLKMTDQNLQLPATSDRLYPYFKAIENLQADIRECYKDQENELQKIAADHEKTLMEKNILLNAQKELYKKLKGQLEKEKSALTARIASQEMELTRISTAIAEKTSALRSLVDMISELDIDHEQKSAMIEHCRRMIDTEMIEKRLSIELTTTDSEFLSRLQRKHPNLNQRELRICLLIKLNYNTRDIARSVGISTRGMESIRYRMHKKIGLSKHQSLKGYLTEMAASAD